MDEVRIEAVVGLTVTSVVIVGLLVNDLTGIGMTDNAALIPAGKFWWDYAVVAFG